MTHSRRLARPVLACAASLALAVGPARAQVDHYISLVVDVSGSIDATEYATQVNAYATLVQDPSFVPTTGVIALNLVFFATTAAEMIPFTTIDSPATATTFANAILSADRTAVGMATNIAAGLDVAAASFPPDEVCNKIILISGDGTDGVSETQEARDAALEVVDTIIGVTIGDVTIQNFYIANVVGGPNGAAFFTADFSGFESALGTALDVLKNSRDCCSPCILVGRQIPIPFVPNGFTPNDDGSNDLWRMRGVHFGISWTVKVWDRFGALIWADGGALPSYIEDAVVLWDGNYGSGPPAADGVYVYSIEIENCKDVRKLAGNVTIDR